MLVTDFVLSLKLETWSVILDTFCSFKKFFKEFLSEKSAPKIGEIGNKELLKLTFIPKAIPKKSITAGPSSKNL